MAVTISDTSGKHFPQTVSCIVNAESVSQKL